MNSCFISQRVFFLAKDQRKAEEKVKEKMDALDDLKSKGLFLQSSGSVTTAGTQ